jgi:hypothetical protein
VGIGSRLAAACRAADGEDDLLRLFFLLIAQ